MAVGKRFLLSLCALALTACADFAPPAYQPPPPEPLTTVLTRLMLQQQWCRIALEDGGLLNETPRVQKDPRCDDSFSVSAPLP